MVLRIEGPQHLPRGYEIVLYVHMSDADKVGVFHMQSKSSGLGCFISTSSCLPITDFVQSVLPNLHFLVLSSSLPLVFLTLNLLSPLENSRGRGW